MHGTTSTLAEHIATRQDLEIGDAIADFWSFARYWYTEDKETESIRLFPVDWQYLQDYDRDVDSAPVTITLKTRRLFVSNYHIAKRAWRAWRCGKDSSYATAIVSAGERPAIELLSRAAFGINRLPEHFRAYNPAKLQAEKIVFERGGEMVGLPATGSASRTFGFSDVLADEMAFWPCAHQMWAALKPTTPKIDMVSTPNGKFNLFGDFWLHPDKYPDFKRIELDWSMHPERGPDWAAKERTQYTPQQWKREQEKSFISMAGQPVYPTYSAIIHANSRIPFEPQPNTVIYRGFDFGFRHPACVWVWQNSRDQICVLREYAPTDIDVRDFLEEVLRISAAEYPDCSFLNYVDPAGVQKWQFADKDGSRSSVEVMQNRFNIRHIEWTKMGVVAGIDLIRDLLKVRADTVPGMLIDSVNCPILCDAFAGGYHYPDKVRHEIEVPVEEPFKDHWHDDPMDALRYVIAGIHQPLFEEDEAEYTPYEEYAEKTDEYGG